MAQRHHSTRSTLGRVVLVGLAAALALAACDNADPQIHEVHELPDWSGLIDLELHSIAFEDGDPIPIEFTCDGDDVSPPLSWAIPPGHAESIVLIVDDPDAPRGVFTHWVVYNVPPDRHALPEDVDPEEEELDDGTMQGVNDFGELGYRGPCPPAGEGHRYRFTILAIAMELDLEPGSTRDEVLELADGILVGGSQLTGIYRRP
jgi:Raf kinase inhibitor-like YbhB/YbcL family protein